MKTIIIGFAIAAATLGACNGSNDATAGTSPQNETMTAKKNDSQQAVVDKGNAQTAATNTAAFPAKEIIAGYLQLKNALAKDNGKDAATAGNAMVATLANVDMKSLPEKQMKSYMEFADDLKEHAEHIGMNAGKIEHQREHFQMLSKDMTDFVKTFGNGGQTLYKDFCPMANDGKGAIWVSEVKEIKNPYLGKAMPTCGSVKETMN